MNAIISFITNKTFITLFGLTLLIILVWFGGAFIGLDLRTRIIIAGIFLLLFLIVFIIKKIIAYKKASQIEEHLKKAAEVQAASARPDQRENMEALKTQLNQAIDSLKKSKLAKRKFGNAALYELPWYIIIGPPSSGKSTLLNSSSLYFPYMTSKGKGVQGVGGTRNCDWWFSNEAVFLDTAGRYVIEEEDKSEWLDFLSLLQKQRKKMPINGAIIGISMSEIIQMTEDELEKCAQKLRDRTDELIQNLNIKFPVYLAFTKCDLFYGFVDFFETLSKTERDQVWGCSFLSEDIKSSGFAQKIKKELTHMADNLLKLRLQKVDTALNQEKRNKIFLFPSQFSAACEPLGRFMELLTQPNPYQESPIFRGFYFSSGTQEGNPIDNIISKIGASLNLPDSVLESFQEEKEKKSYFIKNFFTKVIFPDQSVVQLTTAAQRIQRGMKYLLIVAPCVILITSIFLYYFSYSKNKNFIKKAYQSASKAGLIDWKNNKDILEKISSLDNLRKTLISIGEIENTIMPLSFNLGYYRGNLLNPNLEKIYYNGLKQVFLDPVSKEIEKILIKSANRHPKAGTEAWGEFYDILKLYLMMAYPEKAEKNFMHEKLEKVWISNLKNKGITIESGSNKSEFISSQINFYLSKFTKPLIPKIRPDTGVIKKARRSLDNVSLEMRLYANVKKTNKDIPPFTLNNILQDEQRFILTSKDEVPGNFTREGWETTIRDNINIAWELSEKGDWVLTDVLEEKDRDQKKVSGKKPKDKNLITLSLKKLYVNEFKKTWKKYLKDLNITSFEGMEDASLKLDILSDPDRSPFITLFNELLYHMEIKESSTLGELVKTGVAAVKGVNKNNSLIKKEYAVLQKFLKSKKDTNPSPLNRYLTSLRSVYDKISEINDNSDSGEAALSYTKKILSGNMLEINKGIKLTEFLMKNFNSSHRKKISELLILPYDYAWKILSQTAAKQINRKWKNQIHIIFKEELEGKYPFSKNTSNDASLIDISSFFNKKDGLFWNFYKNEIEPFVKYNGKNIISRKWRDNGIVLSKSFKNFYKKSKMISESLFTDNSDPRIIFELHPHINPQVGEIYIEIEGKNHTFLTSPDEWATFQWPVPDQMHGIEISIKLWKKGWNQEKIVTKNSEGIWGLFKLLDQGTVIQQGGRNFQIAWEFNLEGYSPVLIKFQLKTNSYKNPFRRGGLPKLTCPKSII